MASGIRYYSQNFDDDPQIIAAKEGAEIDTTLHREVGVELARYAQDFNSDAYRGWLRTSSIFLQGADGAMIDLSVDHFYLGRIRLDDVCVAPSDEVTEAFLRRNNKPQGEGWENEVLKAGWRFSKKKDE
jgi:hypothetical protein